MTTTRDRVEAALALAASGWPVFPCVQRGKNPLTRHGFKNASTDPELIRWWWGQEPAANPAVPTGQPGVDVLDVDVKGAADGMAALERLKAAGLLGGALATVRTPSGGLHIYYRGTDQGNGSMAKHGIDFRGKGGYVLVPPSYVVDDEKGYAGPYVWLDWRQGDPGRAVDWEACKRLLDPPRPVQPRLRTTTHTTTRGDVSGLARWVAGQQAGNRNEALYWAACRALDAGRTVTELAALVDAAVSTGLTRRAAEATVTSAENRRPTRGGRTA